MDPQEIERRSTKRVKDFVCVNTHLRIVNQVIYKEFYSANKDWWYTGKYNHSWANKASERLKKDHGVEVAPSTLMAHLRNIKNGTRDGVAASDFTTGFSIESKPLSRYEKDAMHARMEMLEHQFLEKPLYYVGLPANQIVAVSTRYDSVVACEKNEEMYLFMNHIDIHINRRRKTAVWEKDILDFLEHTEERFNVFEFDLMVAINPRLVRRIVSCIEKTAMRRALIAIISVGGRQITAAEYETLMPNMLKTELGNRHFSEVAKSFSGKYKDHKTPMRYELLVIERTSEESNGQL
jgi:hypothetical protein